MNIQAEKETAMRRIIPLLLLLLLAACGQATPEVTTAPAAIPPTTTAVATVPQTTASPAQPAILTYIAIDTPQGWNDFARSFNTQPEGYADTLTIDILAKLDFTGLPFVKLGSGFSGTIQGVYVPDGLTGFFNIATTEAPELEGVRVYSTYSGALLELPTGRDYTDPALLAEYGTEAPAPGGLFGAWVESLTLRDLVLYNITAPNLPWLLGDSIAKLALDKVTISGCHLPMGHSLLCGNAGGLTADRLTVGDCGLYGYFWGAGLTYLVYHDVDIRDLLMDRVSVSMGHDLGGSGVSLAHYSLTVNQVGGAARFEKLRLTSCRVDGAWSYFLTHNSSDTVSCSGLSAYDCRLMALPWPNSPWGDFTTDILFCYLESPAPETADIWLDACIFKAARGLEDYAGLGWYIGRSMSMISWDMPYTE